MGNDILVRRLKEKTELESLVSEVLNEPTLIHDLLDIIEQKGSIKYLCSKTIRLVSEKNPAAVYAYFDEIAGLLQSENSFIKWDGISILSNLVKTDNNSKFDLIFDDYFGLIKGPQMITAANVVGNAWKVILAKPRYETEITKRMLAVPDIVYFNKGEPSSECNNILCGHVIDCFEKYFEVSSLQEDIIEFVKVQLKNTRKSVAIQAEKFLKKFMRADYLS